MTTSLNWKQMVEEALRRRKQEGLTQREHAALANVSIPTMAAFERAETTLTLAKAFDVLRVVGLVDEPAPEDEHERFVREAMARWRELTDTLPKDSPGRMPHGWFRFDYQLVGELQSLDLNEFGDKLRKAKVPFTGRPAFMIPHGDMPSMYEMAGSIETWLNDERRHRDSVGNPSYSDFWRASPTGSLFLICGYQEDGQPTFLPGIILDWALPILRIAEVLLHARRMAALTAANSHTQITVRLRVIYSGLKGRVLRTWATPQANLMIEGYPALSDKTVLELETPAAAIQKELAKHVSFLAHNLYDHFGITNVLRNRILAEAEKMLEKMIQDVDQVDD